jgi:phosphate uptake regulator
MSVDPPALAQMADLFGSLETGTDDAGAEIGDILNQLNTVLTDDDASRSVRAVVEPELRDLQRAVQAYRDAERIASAGIQQAAAEYAATEQRAKEQLLPHAVQRPPAR